MQLIIPAGIGDFSWIWSKLYSVRWQIDKFLVVDGWPHRTTPYIELCGIPSEYMHFSYQQIVIDGRLNHWDSWAQISASGRDTICLEANQHLERGKPLREWLPDLPTYYHYPLDTREHELAVQNFLRDIPRPIVALSCASYRGSEAWKTWGREEWISFCECILLHNWTPIIIGGFWDDLSYTVATQLKLRDMVGKTSVGEGVELLRQIDSYIGFSSGLGVIRTVLDKPAMMLWPEHQVALSRSWAPPEMIESRRYLASQWLPVSDIWPVAKEFLNACREEVQGKKHRPKGAQEAQTQEGQVLTTNAQGTRA